MDFIVRKIAILLLLLVFTRGSFAASEKSESETYASSVKMVLIHKFMAFSMWPENIDRHSLKIGVLGDEDIYELLQTNKDKAPDENKFSIYLFKSIDEYKDVDVLWVSEHKLEATLAKLKKQPVLLIGEGASCWTQNLHICLIPEPKGFRFKLDLFSFQQSGLKISSKVIRLAKEIRK